ncbi:MAG TPA: hypothetical protein VIA18_31960 [Polyangia bacterium]|nr:hypothetical protein [Polyangia bacterium]
MRVRSFIATVTCLAFTTMLLWPYRAHAQPAPAPAAAASDDATMAQAKQHFEAGRAAYNNGDYAGSIREFKQAEGLRPSPVLDYNIGLANEKLGKRRVAVKYYRHYLELQPNAPNKDEVQGRITSLEAAIAQQPPAPTQPGAAPQAEEAPGDMPPPDVNAQGQPQQPQQTGYDPYASAAPGPAQPVVKPKRSYWWIWLIVAGGVALTIGLIVYVALVVDSATTSNNVSTFSAPARSLTNSGSSLDRQQKPSFNGVTLFHF